VDQTLSALIDPLKANPAQGALFLALGAAVLAGSLLTITRRNPVSAVMSLVFTFFALAALYATLSAHFLAVLQVLVYAGAIMVLFIFVVMILNREEVDPISFKGIFTRSLGLVASGYVFLSLARFVVADRAQPLLAAAASGAPADPTYGSVASVGASLFKDFVYPFEAISLLLLVAIVGGVVVSRSARQGEESEASARRRAQIRAAVHPEARVDPAAAAPGPAAGHGDHGHTGHTHAAASR
jgi:NADH-quinone oxidoreductase subunit J